MISKFVNYDPVTKILSGKTRKQIYNINANLGILFLEKLIQNPQNICQISFDTDFKMRNIEMYERSVKYAMHFKELDLKQGDVVGLISCNTDNLVPIMIGCFILGVAVNPLSDVMEEVDIIQMWSKLKPKIVFSEACCLEKVKNAVESMKLDVKIYSTTEKVDGFGNADEILDMPYKIEDFEFPDLPNISSTIAIIACSSGTTNFPKGICKSHKQIIAQSFLMWDRDLKGTEVLLNFIHAYWNTHQLFIVFGILYDIPYVITKRFVTPELWMNAIDKYKVTIVFVSMKFLVDVLNSREIRKLESIRYILMGGSRFSEKFVDEMNKLLPNGKVLASYGLIEADDISISKGHEGTVGLSSGYPYYNVQIKILDDDGNPRGPNETGEICYKTAVSFSGYFQDPESDAETLVGDGFYRSGDLGFFDDEGRLYVIDRIKNMIKSIGTHKVTPGEVEMYINQIDGVLSSCVVGIFDEKVFHEKIHAFIVKDKSKTELTENFVIDFVNSRAIDVKKINGGVYFIDQIPVNSNGKVLYRVLKEMAGKIRGSGNGSY